MSDFAATVRRFAAAVLFLACGLADLAAAAAAADAEPAAMAASAASQPGRAASAPRRRVSDAAAAARPAGAASAAEPQRVEITGAAPDTNEDRRRSTAAKIVFGREELERMGESTIGEVLKRLPGVTISGRPGRGGDIRMRGMGGGYTQILVDGQRMPPGFSLDSVAPDQIERIEVSRGPTAETGTRAIAGTVNVILREDFRKRQNDFKLSLGAELSRPQANAAWTRADRDGDFSWDVSGTGGRQRQGNDTLRLTRETVTGQDAPTLDQRLHSLGNDDRGGLFLSSRLQWKLGGGGNLEVQPFVAVTDVNSRSTGQLDQAVGVTPAPYALAQAASRNRTTMGRLGGSWLAMTEDGARWNIRFNGFMADNRRHTDTVETGAAAAPTRLLVDDLSSRDLSLTSTGKYSKLIAEQHSLAAGWDLQTGQRSDRRTNTDNGVAQLVDFGDEVRATTLRVAGYVQDEWDLSKQWAIYAGLRWEAITTTGESDLSRVSNRSSVWSPLLHLVWRLPDSKQDQVRLGLTRSYRSPNTGQLIARPSISSLYPAAGANQPTSPDRAGNPALKPELASGLDLAFEHYLDAGGMVSANVFARRITDLIRNVTALETVSWSGLQRWVSRPQNIGGALSTGIELEAKFRAADLFDTALPLSVRGNLSLFKSRVDRIPRPDNRIDQQPPYTANFGVDYVGREWPISVGGNLNWTPSVVVRQADDQLYRQGLKRVLDLYALWRASPQMQWRLSLSNAAPQDYDTATTQLLAGGAQTVDTVARTYLTATLRGEFKF
jgi:iron complex outermembrane receptor protein